MAGLRRMKGYFNLSAARDEPVSSLPGTPTPASRHGGRREDAFVTPKVYPAVASTTPSDTPPTLRRHARNKASQPDVSATRTQAEPNNPIPAVKTGPDLASVLANPGFCSNLQALRCLVDPGFKGRTPTAAAYEQLAEQFFEPSKAWTPNDRVKARILLGLGDEGPSTVPCLFWSDANAYQAAAKALAQYGVEYAKIVHMTSVLRSGMAEEPNVFIGHLPLFDDDGDAVMGTPGRNNYPSNVGFASAAFGRISFSSFQNNISTFVFPVQTPPVQSSTTQAQSPESQQLPGPSTEQAQETTTEPSPQASKKPLEKSRTVGSHTRRRSGGSSSTKARDVEAAHNYHTRRQSLKRADVADAVDEANKGIHANRRRSVPSTMDSALEQRTLTRRAGVSMEVQLTPRTARHARRISAPATPTSQAGPSRAGPSPRSGFYGPGDGASRETASAQLHGLDRHRDSERGEPSSAQVAEPQGDIDSSTSVASDDTLPPGALPPGALSTAYPSDPFAAGASTFTGPANLYASISPSALNAQLGSHPLSFGPIGDYRPIFDYAAPSLDAVASYAATFPPMLNALAPPDSTMRPADLGGAGRVLNETPRERRSAPPAYRSFSAFTSNGLTQMLKTPPRDTSPVEARDERRDQLAYLGVTRDDDGDARMADNL